jgi:cardiolipin synthase
MTAHNAPSIAGLPEQNLPALDAEAREGLGPGDVEQVRHHRLRVSKDQDAASLQLLGGLDKDLKASAVDERQIRDVEHDVAGAAGQVAQPRGQQLRVEDVQLPGYAKRARRPLDRLDLKRWNHEGPQEAYRASKLILCPLPETSLRRLYTLPTVGAAREAREDVGNRRILTVPNLLSFVRILLIPLFVVMLLRDDTRLAGFLLLGAVVATDWVDGVIARRTGQVTELGKLLDPLADRFAMAAALITFVVIDVFPLWGALLILGRDAVVLVAAAVLTLTRGPRIEVRTMGKYATFTLLWGMPMIAWGNAGLPFDDLTLALGWLWFPVGAIEYYVAAVLYAIDLRDAYRARRT